MSWNNAIVAKVIDADTLILKKNFNSWRVRLIGIDAFETHENDRAKQQLIFIKNNINPIFNMHDLFDIANEAKQYVADKLLGRQINYRSYGMDKYDRELVYAEYINYSLVRLGYALTFMGGELHYKIKVSLLSAQDDAKKNKDGIWDR